MPLNLTPLPTNLSDGTVGHTAGHNSANSAINAIATAVDAAEAAAFTSSVSDEALTFAIVLHPA